jgi:hypothetical protein
LAWAVQLLELKGSIWIVSIVNHDLRQIGTSYGLALRIGVFGWPVSLAHNRALGRNSAINVYREAIKRTFADVYGVSPATVEVSWTTSKTIVVLCAGKTFLHPILSEPDNDTPEFTCRDEDPVIINLAADERHQLELAV